MMSSYFIVFNIRTVSFGLQTREGKHAAHPGTWSSDLGRPCKYNIYKNIEGKADIPPFQCINSDVQK